MNKKENIISHIKCLPCSRYYYATFKNDAVSKVLLFQTVHWWPISVKFKISILLPHYIQHNACSRLRYFRARSNSGQTAAPARSESSYTHFTLAPKKNALMWLEYNQAGGSAAIKSRWSYKIRFELVPWSLAAVELRHFVSAILRPDSQCGASLHHDIVCINQT